MVNTDKELRKMPQSGVLFIGSNDYESITKLQRSFLFNTGYFFNTTVIIPRAGTFTPSFKLPTFPFFISTPFSPVVK